MSEIKLDAIPVIVELEICGWDFEARGEDEVAVRCPAHADEKPSASINLRSRLWKCHAAGCGADGDIVSFLALALKSTRRVIWEYLTQKYGFTSDKTLDADAVERCHQAIWAQPHMLRELYDRALTEEDVRFRRLGFDRGRITIPIPNANGAWVNMRRYLPGAPGDEKMKNTRGFSDMRLYPEDQLKYEYIVITGGECKAIVTARKLNSYGVGCVTATAGEGNWHPAFSQRLKGKKLYVCMDIDQGGCDAAEKIAAMNYSTAAWLGVVRLPLDIDKYPTGDLNNYWHENHTPDEFMKLLGGVEQWVPKRRQLEGSGNGVYIDLHLSEITAAANVKHGTRTSGLVSAMDETPYLVPRIVQARCDRSQPFCALCPVFMRQPTDGSDGVSMELPADSPAILQMIETSKKGQRDAIKDALGIPPCKIVKFETQEHYNVEDARLSPQLSISSRAIDNITQPCFYVGKGLQANASYRLSGRVHPHPQTQQAVLLATKIEPMEDDLSSYKPTAEDLEKLKVFRPTEWTVDSLGDKLDSIYDDLSANVTQIFKRQDMHLFVDLAYHSVLLLPFDGRTVKGWVEVLIVGDSSQGKSETAEFLMKHYGLGERFVCKRSSESGIMGGLMQMGNRWFVKWGVIPTHDKRLVLLEELKGAGLDTIAALTDMRSSGMAMVGKIETRKTHARTRLVCVSNPRHSREMSSYQFGIEVIKELIGSLEDVRRFDACYIATESQVIAADINRLQKSRPTVVHEYTSPLCRSCILYAWTRTPEQIKFDDGVTERVLEIATEMCSEFVESIPIVDRGSMRYKIARLATSLAARTFSTTDDTSVLLIRLCHVDFVQRFLRRVYSDKTFGYLNFSEAVKSSQTLIDPVIIEKRILQAPFPSDLVDQLIRTNDIELQDVRDWCGWDQGEAMQLVSFLVRKQAMIREKRCYRKTPAFIDLLRALRTSDAMKMADRPSFIKDEF